MGRKNGKSAAHREPYLLTDHPDVEIIPQVPRLALARAEILADVSQAAVCRRLSRALVGTACINLMAMALCQWIYVPDGRADYRHPLLWVVDVAAVLGCLRLTLGPGWARSSPAISLITKLWTTFLILSFSVVTLNAFTGYELAWYKPVWATLSTFLFASLAWIFSPWLFIPAVQMWATGLLMVNFTHWAFLIYGVSWWLALVGVVVVKETVFRPRP